MNKTQNVLAIAAFAAILAAVPTFTQEADASMAYVPQTNDAIGFDVTVNFDYDIESGERTYSYNTYAIGCTDRLTVTSLYAPGSDKQSMAWVFPSSINYLCGISELSDYTNFVLTGVDWSVQSSNNANWNGSSGSSQGTQIGSGFTSDDGVVQGTFTAHYVWET